MSEIRVTGHQYFVSGLHVNVIDEFNVKNLHRNFIIVTINNGTLYRNAYLLLYILDIRTALFSIWSLQYNTTLKVKQY